MSALKKKYEEKIKNLSIPHIDEVEESEHDENAELWLLSYADMMTLLMAFFALLLSFTTFDTEKLEKSKVSEEFGGKFENPHEEVTVALKQLIESNKLKGLVKIEKHPKGVVLSFRGNVLFASAAVEFRDATLPMVSEVISIIREKANEYNLVIEGHTDDAPISYGAVKSNWELSALRASTLARSFEQAGFSKTNIKIVGFGDSRPLVPNRNKEGKKIRLNMAKNRRVVIKVLKLKPKEKIKSEAKNI